MRLRPGDLHWQLVDDEVVILDLRSSRYLGLNRSGAFLWHRLAHHTTREQLVTDLASEFGVDEERARRDVDSFLGALFEQELISTS